MKSLKNLSILVALFCFVILSCSKDADSVCIEQELRTDWQTEDFKTDYTIQFPSDYEGNGMVGFEGNLFSKNNPDSSVIMYYFYCGPLWCDDFGDSLSVLGPNTSVLLGDGISEVFLDQCQEFCIDDELVGKLYHNEKEESFGAYFMNVDGIWREGLRVEYNEAKQDELNSILATIINK